MRLLNWLILQASLIAVVLSISLSGLGMAQAHSLAAPDTPVADHSAHAHMDHAHHGMTGSDHDLAHEGHATCPMIACCHTTGAGTLSVPSLSDAVTFAYRPADRLRLHEAEPESAKKPPKHA